MSLGGRTPVAGKFDDLEAGPQKQVTSPLETFLATLDGKDLEQVMSALTAKTSGSRFYKWSARQLAARLDVDGVTEKSVRYWRQSRAV